MFERFADLGPVGRYGLAFFFLGLGTVAWVCGYFWPWAWAVGAALLLFAMLLKN